MTPADPSTEPRAPLSRDRVLQAAIRLADEGGIESLSMRKLGQALGVEAMSLYNHVERKDDVLAGILALVLGEIEPPPPAVHWKAALRQTAVSAHDVLVRHPWACNLMHSPAAASPHRLRWMDAVLGTLREAGFSPELTHHAYHALDSHITGFTMWQVSIDVRPEDVAALGAAFLRELPPDFPYLAEHVEQHLAPSSPDGKTEFEFGLDLILDGLETMLDAE
ncbi:MAG TPA: TetR/AcrR family transcriptional regulator C-terminal domain-containing protein [Gaiellaceae bacterium]|jgi:AcrR family transcriptional regulator|nr:TetR/AcrR family transcriptional regulator C-terminal domain-containing protein [Gaiellaceae bacterium]